MRLDNDTRHICQTKVIILTSKIYIGLRRISLMIFTEEKEIRNIKENINRIMKLK